MIALNSDVRKAFCVEEGMGGKTFFQTEAIVLCISDEDIRKNISFSSPLVHSM